MPEPGRTAGKLEQNLPGDEPGDVFELANQDDDAFAKRLGLSEDAGEQETEDDAEGSRVQRSEDGAGGDEQPGEAEEEAQEEQEGDEEGAEGEEVEGEEAGEQEGEEEPEKEKEAGEQAVEEEKPLLTKFAMHDNESELEIPRDVVITYTANGKERKDPIDKVVLLAQMGVYNEEREKEVRAAKKFVPQVLEENKQLKGQLDALTQDYDKLFASPDLYEEARALWSQHNSPEQRAARAEAAIKAERVQQAQNQQAQQAVGFIQGKVVPAVSSLLQKYPTIPQLEMMGAFNQYVTPLLENGRVPLHQLTEVERIVTVDLAHWAEETHTSRAAKETEAKKKTDAKVKAEKTKTALQKRKVAKAVKPKGKSGGTRPQPKARTEHMTAEDFINSRYGSGPGYYE